MINNKASKLAIILLVLIFSAFFIPGCGAADTDIELDTDVGAPETEAPITEDGPIAIGLSWMEDTEEDPGEDMQVYIDAVTETGAVAVRLALITDADEARDALADVDAIIMTGGEDIDPAEYGEEADENLEDVNKDRDTNDFLLLKAAVDMDMPVLATCRGLQVLNVMQGGTLIQDIPTQVDTNILHRSLDEVDFVFHNVTVDKDSLVDQIMGTTKLDANSWHHQAIKDLGNGLTVTGKADDGIIEIIEMDEKTFVLGVQFHPEWHVAEGQGEYIAFFERLYTEAENYKNQLAPAA